MEKSSEPTIGFSLWPVLLMLEGPSNMIGIALAAIYNDPKIDRAQWHCDHALRSRLEFAAHLRGEGKKPRRLGVGATTDDVAALISAKALACGLKSVIFRGTTTPSKAVDASR